MWIKMAKSLKAINNPVTIVLAIFWGCLFFSCKKENPPNAASGTFIKTLQTDSVSYATFVKQLADGGFMIIASDGAGRPLIIRTDGKGNARWEKTTPEYCFPISSTLSQHWWVTEQNPNLFTLQAGIYTTNIDSSGDIINVYHFPNSSYYYFANGPVLKNDSNYFVAMSDGNDNYYSYNYIFTYDANLVYQKEDVIKDSIMGGKTLEFFVYGVTGSGAYNIWGQKLPRNNWSWFNNPKIFIAKVHGNAPPIQTEIDTGDLHSSDAPEFQVPGPDSSIILLVQRTDYNTNSTYPLVLKFDKNMNLVWKKLFPSTAGSINLYDMSACNDGGFIITGQVQGFGFNDQYPYALKIDANGNPQWSKTIAAKGNGRFMHGIMTQDGGYVLVGHTNAFGKGLNGNRILFIKTDANGNL